MVASKVLPHLLAHGEPGVTRSAEARETTARPVKRRGRNIFDTSFDWSGCEVDGVLYLGLQDLASRVLGCRLSKDTEKVCLLKGWEV